MNPLRLLALAGMSVLALSACSATTAAEPAPRTATIDNCGFPVEVGDAPQRILTIKSSATELALALGLAERMVGTAFPDGDLPPAWADLAADIPLISERAPGTEAVLALEPDLVFAGWESNLAADTAGERDRLESFGIRSYVAPSACKGDYQPDRLDFELLFEHFLEAGLVLGADDAAADLVAEQRDRLASLEPPSEPHTALWYSSGKDTPYVGAGIGAPQMMLDAAGLTNIAGDIDDTWASLSWEVVIDADPDVIVLVDAAWNTAASKIAYLQENPATASLTAVREHRFLTVPFPASEGGVRSIDAVEGMLAQLDELDLP